MTKVSTHFTSNFNTSLSVNKELIRVKNTNGIKKSTLDFLISYSSNLQVIPSTLIGELELFSS
jgi:hypothetical protein